MKCLGRFRFASVGFSRIKQIGTSLGPQQQITHENLLYFPFLLLCLFTNRAHQHSCIFVYFLPCNPLSLKIEVIYLKFRARKICSTSESILTAPGLLYNKSIPRSRETCLCKCNKLSMCICMYIQCVSSEKECERVCVRRQNKKKRL